MKIIIVLFILLSSVYGAKIDEFAKEASYFRDYNSALVIAKKENKILMLVLVADFCPWCKKFERKTLENKSVSSLVDENFIPVIVDNYRDKEYFPKELSTKKLPRVYFINANTQEVINKSNLYVKKNDFLIIINETLKIDKDSIK